MYIFRYAYARLIFHSEFRSTTERSVSMTRKRWALLSLTMLILALFSIVAAVVIIDPFQIYRRATMYIPPITNSTQNYFNAGIAKTYDYDSAIIGSSMTENFTPSQLDAELGGHFVKLPINGGSSFNHKQMMDLAFATHDLKTVFYGIDVEALTFFYKTPKCDMPDYLYDDNLFNDTQYWFNKSVLAIYIPQCLKTLGQRDDTQSDTMYNWGALYDYGKDAVLRGVTISDKEVPQEARPKDPVLNQQSMLNMEYNFIPYVEGHPDTEFIFFFPPYSLVRWYELYSQKLMGSFFAQKEAIIERLLPYENVRIYDFQAELEWINNLDNYIDPGHYGPWINDEMVRLIAKDQYRITDVSQAQANNDVLEAEMTALRAAGPAYFD